MQCLSSGLSTASCESRGLITEPSVSDANNVRGRRGVLSNADRNLSLRRSLPEASQSAGQVSHAHSQARSLRTIMMARPGTSGLSTIAARPVGVIERSSAVTFRDRQAWVHRLYGKTRARSARALSSSPPGCLGQEGFPSRRQRRPLCREIPK